MRSLLECRLLFVFLFLMLSVQSEADRGKTCEADYQYTDGLIVYSELLLDSVKKEMTRLMEECNATKRAGTIIIKGLDDCLNTKEDMEKDMLAITNEKEDLEKEIHRLHLLHSMQVEDQCTMKQALEMSPLDCGDIQVKGARESGLYNIKPNRTGDEVSVLCDLETRGGGWTVFLKRDKEMKPTNFNRSWWDYREGFGDKSSEFWLGNDLLHILTSGNDPVTLRVEAQDFDGDTKWGEWKVFKVDSEEHKYRLTAEKYQNKSSLLNSLATNNGLPFSTWDRDNDNFPYFTCANGLSGTGGWWYNNCGYTRPTGNLANTGREKDEKSYLAHWCNLIHRGKCDPWLFKNITMKLRRSRYKLSSLLNMRNIC